MVAWASNFGSGRDLTVHGFEPSVGLCADSLEPDSDSVPPSLSAPPPPKLALSLSLSLSLSNKHLKKFKKRVPNNHILGAPGWVSR